MTKLNSLRIGRAVFDCNVLLQAMANPKGPAGACMDSVCRGNVVLFVSPPILAELSDVACRPTVMRKLAYSHERIANFLEVVRSYAVALDHVAEVYAHPTDPKDNPYVNLAIAADADVIVSRDRHLLSLCDPASSTGVQFVSKFPGIEVLTPVELLEQIKRG